MVKINFTSPSRPTDTTVPDLVGDLGHLRGLGSPSFPLTTFCRFYRQWGRRPSRQGPCTSRRISSYRGRHPPTSGSSTSGRIPPLYSGRPRKRRPADVTRPQARSGTSGTRGVRDFRRRHFSTLSFLRVGGEGDHRVRVPPRLDDGRVLVVMPHRPQGSTLQSGSFLFTQDCRRIFFVRPTKRYLTPDEWISGA